MDAMRVAQVLALALILAVSAACDDGYAPDYGIALDIESGDERRLTGGEQSIHAIELSPDGSRLAAIAGYEDRIAAVVLDADDGTELHRLDLGSYLAIGPFVAWRTDTELLVMRGEEDDVYGTNAVLASWDLATAGVRDIARFDGGGCCQNRLVVAPDASAVAVSSARQAYLVTLPDGLVTPLVDDVEFASAVDWTPGFVFMIEAAAGEGAVLRRKDLSAGTVDTLRMNLLSHTVSVAPDARSYALIGEGELIVAALETGEERSVLGGLDPGTGRPDAEHWVSEVTPVWSPDGSRIAIAMDQGIAIVDPATGDYERFVRHGDLQAWSMAWSPDGETLYLTVRKAHRGD